MVAPIESASPGYHVAVVVVHLYRGEQSLIDRRCFLAEEHEHKQQDACVYLQTRVVDFEQIIEAIPGGVAERTLQMNIGYYQS